MDTEKYVCGRSQALPININTPVVRAQSLFGMIMSLFHLSHPIPFQLQRFYIDTDTNIFINQSTKNYSLNVIGRASENLEDVSQTPEFAIYLENVTNGNSESLRILKHSHRLLYRQNDSLGV